MTTGRSRLSLAAACAAVIATLAAGCGGTGGAITIVGSTAQPAPPRLTASAVAVGPGPVHARVSRGGYDVVVRVAPNRATTANRISVSLSRDGGPVAGAHVGMSAGMLTMAMGVGRYTLTGSSTYRAELPAWQMPGRWGLVLTVKPPGAAPVRVVLDDAIRR